MIPNSSFMETNQSLTTSFNKILKQCIDVFNAINVDNQTSTFLLALNIWTNSMDKMLIQINKDLEIKLIRESSLTSFQLLKIIVPNIKCFLQFRHHIKTEISTHSIKSSELVEHFNFVSQQLLHELNERCCSCLYLKFKSLFENCSSLYHLGFNSNVDRNRIGLNIRCNGKLFRENILALGLSVITEISHCLMNEFVFHYQYYTSQEQYGLENEEISQLYQSPIAPALQYLLKRIEVLLQSLSREQRSQSTSGLPVCTTTLEFLQRIAISAPISASDPSGQQMNLDHFLWKLLWVKECQYSNRMAVQERRQMGPSNDYTKKIELLDSIWHFLLVSTPKRKLIESIVIALMDGAFLGEDKYPIDNSECSRITEKKGRKVWRCESGDLPVTKPKRQIVPFLFFKGVYTAIMFGICSSFIEYRDDRNPSMKDSLNERENENGGIDFSHSENWDSGIDEDLLDALEDGFISMAAKYVEWYLDCIEAWIALEPTSPSPLIEDLGHLRTLHLGLIIDLCECCIFSGKWNLLQSRLNTFVKVEFIEHDCVIHHNSISSMRLNKHQQNIQSSPFRQLFKIHQLLRIIETTVGIQIFSREFPISKSGNPVILLSTTNAIESILDCFELSEMIFVDHLHSDFHYLQSLLALQLKYYHRQQHSCFCFADHEIRKIHRGEQDQPDPDIDHRSGNNEMIFGNPLFGLSLWSLLTRRFVSQINWLMMEEALMTVETHCIHGNVSSDHSDVEFELKKVSYFGISCDCNRFPWLRFSSISSLLHHQSILGPFTKKSLYRFYQNSLNSSEIMFEPSRVFNHSLWKKLLSSEFDKMKRHAFLHRLFGNWDIPSKIYEMNQSDFVMELQRMTFCIDSFLSSKQFTSINSMDQSNDFFHYVLPSELRFGVPPIVGCSPLLSSSHFDRAEWGTSPPSRSSCRHSCTCVHRVISWIVQQHGGVEQFHRACRDGIILQLLKIFTSTVDPSTEASLEFNELRNQTIWMKRVVAFVEDLHQRFMSMCNLSAQDEMENHEVESNNLDKRLSTSRNVGWDWTLSESEQRRIIKRLGKIRGIVYDSIVSMKLIWRNIENNRECIGTTSLGPQLYRGHGRNNENRQVIEQDDRCVTHGNQWTALKMDRGDEQHPEIIVKNDFDEDFHHCSKEGEEKRLDSFSCALLVISEQFWPKWIFGQRRLMSKDGFGIKSTLMIEESIRWNEANIMNELIHKDLSNFLIAMIRKYEFQHPGKTIELLPHLLYFELTIGQQGESRLKNKDERQLDVKRTADENLNLCNNIGTSFGKFISDDQIEYERNCCGMEEPFLNEERRNESLEYQSFIYYKMSLLDYIVLRHLIDEVNQNCNSMVIQNEVQNDYYVIDDLDQFPTKLRKQYSTSLFISLFVNQQTVETLRRFGPLINLLCKKS